MQMLVVQLFCLILILTQVREELKVAREKARDCERLQQELSAARFDLETSRSHHRTLTVIRFRKMRSYWQI